VRINDVVVIAVTEGPLPGFWPSLWAPFKTFTRIQYTEFNNPPTPVYPDGGPSKGDYEVTV
jgi:hypothetical protein